MAQQRWDNASVKRLSHFLNNSSNIPRLLRGVFGATPSRNADLRRLFEQLVEFLTLEPTTEVLRLRVATSIKALFAAGVLGTIIDIVNADEWYIVSEESLAENLKILDGALQSLGLLLHHYREAEDLYEPGMAHLETQDAENRIPRLFSKLWDHRHDLLPLPLDGRFPRKLERERESETAVDKLEATIAQAITDYESAFGSSIPVTNPYNEQVNRVYPKITFEGALLSLHCLARTRQHRVFWNAASRLTVIWVSSTFEPILGPLWRKALADSALSDCIRRQLTARLCDEDIVDLSMIQCGSVVMSFLHHIPRWDSVEDWTRFFRSFLEAARRQICQGALGPGAMEYFSLLSDIFGTIHALLAQTSPSISSATTSLNGSGYPGDISKLGVVGVLAQASVESCCNFRSYNSILPSSIQRCARLAQQYQTEPGGLRSFEKLVEEAAVCVPSTIRALREVAEYPTVTAEIQGPVTRLIEAWRHYAQAVGVAETSTAVPPRVFAFRTCSLRTCLCNGGKPAHRLRICTGCWQAFYCGKKCQTEAWRQWGHREWCRQQRGDQRSSSI